MSRLFKRMLSITLVFIMTATMFFSNWTWGTTEVKAAQTLGAGSIGVGSNEKEAAKLPRTNTQGKFRFTTDNYNNNNEALDTNDWASNFLWDLEGDRNTDSTGALSGTAYAFPLYYLVKKDGLRVSKPSMTSNETNVSAYYVKDNDTLGDFIIYPEWEIASNNIDDSTDWSYKSVSANANNTSQMITTMTQGVPFAYIELKNSNVFNYKKCRATEPSALVYSGTYEDCVMYVFRTRDTVSSVNGYPSATYQYYALYLPAGSTVQYIGTDDGTGVNDGIGINKVTLPSNRTYFSFAWLDESRDINDEIALNYAKEYRPYAFNFITDTRADYSYNESTSTLTTTYKYTVEKKAGSTADGTIMGLIPHQYKNMSNYSTMGNDAITLRGMMKFMKGSSYTTNMTYKGILPFMPELSENDTAGQAQLQAYVDQFVNTYMSGSGDWTLAKDEGHETYYHGKKLNRSAQVIAAAKSVGDEESATRVLEGLEANLEDWFTYSGSSDKHYFKYLGEGVGVLLGYPTSFNAVDQFNDHHFHYGYFIQSAACVGLWDKEWLNQYKDVVKQLIYDIASPYRNQNDCVSDCGNAYPYLRSFGPYEGHSWASGYEDERTGNNQESTSEAINAWAGIILFGEMIGDDEIRDLGIYLYTTEIAAADNYWFDKDEDIYKIDDSKYEAPMASMVWGGKADYGTWFGLKYTQGIQICPMQSWSFYLANDAKTISGENYIKKFYNADKTFGPAQGGSTGEWNDMWAAYYALADPQTAMNSVWTKSAINDGESQAHTYHYIQSLIDYGTPDLSYTSNNAMSSVFTKNGVQTFAVYNAESAAKTVTFTDASGKKTQVLAAPNKMTLLSSKDAGKPTYNIEYYVKNLNNNGYTLIDSTVKYADAGTTVTATAKSITGYSYESGNSNNITSDTVNANGSTILKLYYTRNTYSVSYQLNGGTKSNASLYTSSYTYGETYSLDRPVRDGYTFMGWYKDSSFSNKITSIEAKTNGNLTLYARWVLAGTILLSDDAYLEFDSNLNGTFVIIGDQIYKSVNVLYKLCNTESEAASEAANKTESGYVAWGMNATNSGWTRTDPFGGNKGQYIVFYFIRYDDAGGYKTDYAYGEIGGDNTVVETTQAPQQTSPSTTTSSTPSGDNTVKAPTGLVYAGNEALPYYFAWGSVDGASSYNVYVNGTLVGNSVASAYNIDSKYFTTNGAYTVGVTAVNSAGVESSMTTTVYEVTNGTEVAPTTTTAAPETTPISDGYITLGDGTWTTVSNQFALYAGTWDAGASMSYKGSTEDDLSLKVLASSGTSGTWGIQVARTNSMTAAGLEEGKKYKLVLKYNSTSAGEMLVKLSNDYSGIYTTNAGENTVEMEFVYSNSLDPNIDAIESVGAIVLELSGLSADTVISNISVSYEPLEVETTTIEPETSTEPESSKPETVDPSTITDWTLVTNSLDVYYYICDGMEDKINVKPQVEGDNIYTAYGLAAIFSSVTVNGVEQKLPDGAFYRLYLDDIAEAGYYTVTVTDYYGNESVTIIYKVDEKETEPEPTTEEPTTEEPTTTTVVEDTDKPAAPGGLTYAGNEALPYYFAWQAVADAVSYNVYVNNIFVGTTAGGAYDIPTSYFTTAGIYTVGVTAVNASGVESSMTTIEYVVELDSEEPVETTKEEQSSKPVEETTKVPVSTEITISGDIKIEGYQISHNVEGSRVVGSVEPTIDGRDVANWGFVYAITNVNGIDLDVKDSDMYVGSDHIYVTSLESTPIGTSSVVMGESKTATYFVRTTLFSAKNKREYTAQYKVRAYAKLVDGSYVYSDVSSYSVFDISNKLYQNKLMNTLDAHNYLYTEILTVVDSDYKKIDYNWSNTVVKPSDMK